MEECFHWPGFQCWNIFLLKELKQLSCLLALILKPHVSSFTQDKVRRMCCCCVFRLFLLWLTVPATSADGNSRNNCRQIDSGALIHGANQDRPDGPQDGSPDHHTHLSLTLISAQCVQRIKPASFWGWWTPGYSIGHFPWSHSLLAWRGRKDLKGSIQSRGKRFRSVVSHLQESSHRPSESSAALLQTGICFPFCLFFPSRPNILPLSEWIPPRWQRMRCEGSDGAPLISKILPGGPNSSSSGSLQTLNVLKEITTEPFHFSPQSICHPSTSLFFFIPSEFGQITAVFITEKLCLHLRYAWGPFPSLELWSQVFKNLFLKPKLHRENQFPVAPEKST